MSAVQSFQGSCDPRPCVLIAAYDVACATSEGYVALSLLQKLSPHLRIILITRKNNAESLRLDALFRKSCPTIRLVGLDLPRWTRWWKKGARFYIAYVYLWQLWWPVVVWFRKKLLARIDAVHVLNFHNDSIPSLAWCLGKPTVWGPINHNETIPAWRVVRWPQRIVLRSRAKGTLRALIWRLDPLLRLTVAKMGVILAAGPWVDARLKLGRRSGIVRRSQLGLDRPDAAVTIARSEKCDTAQLIYAGRLDWIKGVDLAIEAMVMLAPQIHLTVIGDGPARSMLTALAEELGVAERVSFRPPMPRVALLSEFRNYDALLFPSAEVAGLVWVEALGHGLPVVAYEGETEVAMAAEQLPGIILAPTSNDHDRNIEAFSLAIKDCLQKQMDREAIASAALKRYGWDKFAAELLAIYRGLLPDCR